LFESTGRGEGDLEENKKKKNVVHYFIVKIAGIWFWLLFQGSFATKIKDNYQREGLRRKCKEIRSKKRRAPLGRKGLGGSHQNRQGKEKAKKGILKRREEEKSRTNTTREIIAQKILSWRHTGGASISYFHPVS